MDQRRGFNAIWNLGITTLYSFTSMIPSNSDFPLAASSTAERVNKETQNFSYWEPLAHLTMLQMWKHSLLE